MGLERVWPLEVGVLYWVAGELKAARVFRSNFVPRGYAFTKKERLLVRADFDRVFKEGVAVRSQYVTLFARISSLSSSRLGIIVTKKNVPNAVDRNRIKRVIREHFRCHRQHSPWWEMVAIAHKGSGQLPSRALRDVLEQTWTKLFTSPFAKRGG